MHPTQSCVFKKFKMKFREATHEKISKRNIKQELEFGVKQWEKFLF